ncbi:MAG TPA: cupin domain-containing protein [Rhizomicrobium sp.]|nr:cupin domain-containing protein [Rhizomicrobium sp.]
MKRYVLALAAMAAASAAHAADAPRISVAPLARTSTTITGEKIDVPSNPEVVSSIATFPPGAELPIHKHPYPHYVYVLEGNLTVFNVDTGKSFVAKQGQFIVETNASWHYGKNEGTVPVKLLVIDQLPAGVMSNMDVKGSK